MRNTDLCVAREPNLFERIVWRVKAWRHRNDPGNLELHAIREFKALGYQPVSKCEDDPNKWMQENVLELIRVFGKQGHSGFSAPYCIDLFSKLAKFEPACPLQGTDDEWNDVGDGLWQNKRCSRVFKDSDGLAYNIEGRIFREPDGVCYTSRESRVYITFPYVPASEYVEVMA